MQSDCVSCCVALGGFHSSAVQARPVIAPCALMLFNTVCLRTGSVYCRPAKDKSPAHVKANRGLANVSLRRVIGAHQNVQAAGVRQDSELRVLVQVARVLQASRSTGHGIQRGESVSHPQVYCVGRI